MEDPRRTGEDLPNGEEIAGRFKAMGGNKWPVSWADGPGASPAAERWSRAGKLNPTDVHEQAVVSETQRVPTRENTNLMIFG